jgi:hypothetical protein
MQRDWVDYMTALGTVGAAVVSLIAVAVALWIATSDRRREFGREQRERKVQAGQRRVDEAVVVLEAWERLWALVPKPWDADAEDPWTWRQTPEWRASAAHLNSVVRASGERFTYARSGFRHFGYDEEYGARYLAQEHDLGVVGDFQVFDPETEDDSRRIIRMEILEVIAEARRQMASPSAS